MCYNFPNKSFFPAANYYFWASLSSSKKKMAGKTSKMGKSEIKFIHYWVWAYSKTVFPSKFFLATFLAKKFKMAPVSKIFPSGPSTTGTFPKE